MAFQTVCKIDTVDGGVYLSPPLFVCLLISRIGLTQSYRYECFKNEIKEIERS